MAKVRETLFLSLNHCVQKGKERLKYNYYLNTLLMNNFLIP